MVDKVHLCALIEYLDDVAWDADNYAFDTARAINFLTDIGIIDRSKIIWPANSIQNLPQENPDEVL